MTNEQFDLLIAKLDEIKAAINPPQCRAPDCIKNAVSNSTDGYCEHHEFLSQQLSSMSESLIEGDPNTESWKRKSDRCSAIEAELGV